MKEIEKDLYKPLADAFKCVGELDGVNAPRYPEEEIGVSAGFFDNYLAAFYLGQLIEREELEIKIKPEREAYLKKLLHMDKEEE